MADDQHEPEEVASSPPARDVIEALQARLGGDGLRALIAACLRSIDRAQAVKYMNSALGTIRLPPSTDRGRMARLILDGLDRHSEAALEVVQTLARTPFESKASEAQRQGLEQAIEALNRARAAQDKPGVAASPHRDELRKAAAGVVAVLADVIGPEDVRRMVQLNAFPDTLDALLAAVDERGGA